MEEKRETMRREGKKKKKKRETGADTERKYSHRCTSVVIHWISPAIISVIARKHRDMENSWKSRRYVPRRVTFAKISSDTFNGSHRVFYIRETILPAAHERFQLN